MIYRNPTAEYDDAQEIEENSRRQQEWISLQMCIDALTDLDSLFESCPLEDEEGAE